MAEVKWIKIATDIFDDEKILLIESMPDSYAIITAWFKLLCLAGKMNNSGVFIMNDRIAYTDKMLATVFRMKEATVKLALDTFERFGMIKRIDGAIAIPNWGKHQNLDSIERKREYQRGYMSAVDCQKNHLSPQRYDFYRKKFLKLQEMFPPQRDVNQVTEIQRELFLLVTGFFHLGCNDPEFQNLTIVRFYRGICEIADQKAAPDPALLWSFPWESDQKAEYNQTGDIRIYHRLCDIIRANPDIIKRAKCKFEKELANFIADKDGQARDHEIKLLHDLSSLSTTKVLDKNGIITRSDSTNKPDFFNDPVELPDGLTKEEMQYLPRCIREYTALSLFRERLANEMKETAFDMLVIPYRGD